VRGSESVVPGVDCLDFRVRLMVATGAYSFDDFGSRTMAAAQVQTIG
jgi:hypothetical protein